VNKYFVGFVKNWANISVLKNYVRFPFPFPQTLEKSLYGPESSGVKKGGASSGKCFFRHMTGRSAAKSTLNRNNTLRIFLPRQ
jgi:hypothetical protein